MFVKNKFQHVDQMHQFTRGQSNHGLINWFLII